MENELKIESTDIIFANISEATLRAAGNIFIYIHPMTSYVCPFSAFNKWFSVWLPFYTDLFKTQSAEKIILTLKIFVVISHEKLVIIII